MGKIGQRALGIFIVLLTVLTLFGCSSNIFQPFVEDKVAAAQEEETTENLDSALDDAVSSTDFKKIREQTEKLLSGVGLTDTQKSSALALKGKAILGENNVGTLDLTDKIQSIAKNTDATAENAENVYDKITNLVDPSVPTEDLRSAAQSLNEANSLAGDAALDKDTQMVRGVANSLVAVDMLSGVYDFEDGAPIAKNEELSPRENLDLLFDPDGDPSTNDGVADFSDAAAEGFTAAGALTEEQAEQVAVLSSSSEQLRGIQTALEDPSGESTYTYTNTDGEEVAIDGNASDEELNQAIQSIFVDVDPSSFGF